MPERKTKRRLIYFVPLVVLSVGIVLYLLYSDGGRSKPVYQTALVEQGSIVSTVSSTGTLAAKVTVQVGSQISGQIKELPADFNSEVHAGQVIARIAPENFEAKVRQAEADVALAKANLSVQSAALQKARSEPHGAQAGYSAARAQTEKARLAVDDARRNLERSRSLFQRGVTSQSELDDKQAIYDQALAQLRTAEAQQNGQTATVRASEAQLQMAEAQLEQARAQLQRSEAFLDQARIDLDHTFIRSPVDGVVIGRSVDVGQTVAASLQAPTLFTIAQDLRHMQVNVNLDEADIGRIAVGQRATFTVDTFPGRDFEGRVEQIRLEPQTIQNVVTYTVIVSAENPDLALLPGMTATVQVVVSERMQAIKVPNTALRFRPEEAGARGAPNANAALSGSNGGRPSGQESERLARLTEALALTPDQQAQIRAVYSTSRSRIQAMREDGASPEDVQSQTEQIRKEARSAILPILTPEQREKFNRLNAARATDPATPGQVWILGADGIPKPVDIATDISDGTYSALVRGDLQPGQAVIVGSNQMNKPSSKPQRPRFGF